MTRNSQHQAYYLSIEVPSNIAHTKKRNAALGIKLTREMTMFGSAWCGKVPYFVSAHRIPRSVYENNWIVPVPLTGVGSKPESDTYSTEKDESEAESWLGSESDGSNHRRKSHAKGKKKAKSPEAASDNNDAVGEYEGLQLKRDVRGKAKSHARTSHAPSVISIDDHFPAALATASSAPAAASVPTPTLPQVTAMSTGPNGFPVN
ncbi:hypothetical protein B0H17DRAFT_1129568 [Mycena rosella]|uniref:Uncharacterized protein n=1 Tax=Mycena rosella TaxID=1033263 RepID=A0AAD7DV90_MYCRO|nr:hypothetical protein B0H17DRAFT_1129568 [Mycena rosella]